jgi:hypothetical protein
MESTHTSFKERLPVMIEKITEIVVDQGMLSDEEFFQHLKKRNVDCNFLEVQAVAGLLLGITEGGTHSTRRH